jgi:hypothetical protein
MRSRFLSRFLLGFLALSGSVAVAGEALDCSRMSNREISRACIQSAPVGKEFKNVKHLLKCDQAKKGLHPAIGRYQLSFDGNRIQIRQKMDFSYWSKSPSDASEEDVHLEALEGRRREIESYLRWHVEKIRMFWALREVDYQADFVVETHRKTRKSRSETADPRLSILLLDWPGRSFGSVWYLGGNTASYRPENAIGGSQWSNRMMHELAHAMGLQDAYLENCFYAPDELPCSDGTGSGCQNLMYSTAGALERQEFSWRDFYTLVRPLCPDLCRLSAK